MDSAKIYDQVREHYNVASKGISSQYSETIAKSFGYSEAELASIPEGANLGLSCGNPLAIASVREGETIIDLGSGAGFDVFLASSKIGPTGRAIGVDMNDDMLARADQNKASQGEAAANVTFVKGVITDIPLESGIADCIISNCVINLVPAADKPLVFKEMHRLLKPGGRAAVSDILAKKELPDWLRNNMAMYVGCIAGTSQLAEYKQWLKDAGFRDILIADTHADLNVYVDTAVDGSRKKAECCVPPSVAPGGCVGASDKPCCDAREKQSECCALPAASGDDQACCDKTKDKACCSAASDSSNAPIDIKNVDLNEWAGSYKIYAVKD